MSRRCAQCSRRADVRRCLGVSLAAPRVARRPSPSTRSSRSRSPGVTDTVILALIDRDQTVFAIRAGADRRAAARRAQRTGDSGDAQERPRRRRAGGARRRRLQLRVDCVDLATEPDMVTVGHGPDRPNTPHIDGFYSGPPAPAFPRPYDGPTFRYRSPSRIASLHRSGRRASQPRALCYAQISTHALHQPAAVCHRLSGRDAADAPIDVADRYRSDRDEIPHLPALTALLAPRPRRPASQAQKSAAKRAPQKIDEEYTRTDQAEPAGSADHHRARRSPAGVRHRAVAAQVPRPRRRRAGRADLREGHLPLLRGARQGGADAREVLEDRHHRRRPRHRPARDRRRGRRSRTSTSTATCSAS